MALAVLFDLVREINRVRVQDESAAAGLGAELRLMSGVLGILQGDSEAYLKNDIQAPVALITVTGHAGVVTVGPSQERIEVLITQRLAARKAKQWGEADRIRDELAAAGIVLEDGAGGTTWRRG